MSENGAKGAGQKKRKIVGYYGSFQDLLDHPAYIDALQKELGVNLVLAGGPIRIPQEILDMNPAPGLGPNQSVGCSWSEDDSLMHRGIEEAHRRGMDVLNYMGGTHYGLRAPELCVVDFEGRRLCDVPQTPYSVFEYNPPVCMARPDVRAWLDAVYGLGAGNYDVEGVYVSHFRYDNPSQWNNLFGCACPYCELEAYRKGYDFERMEGAMRLVREKLTQLTKAQVEATAKCRLTFGDFLMLLSDAQEVWDWLQFRASVVGDALRIAHDAVHRASKDRAIFVTDTHMPTMALYVGHNWMELQKGITDRFHPLAWLDSQHLACVASWANLLCTWVEGLEERTALQVVYSFFGWDELPLAKDRIADMGMNKGGYLGDEHSSERFYKTAMGPERIFALYSHEMDKMKMLNVRNIPAHPVIKGDWPVEVARRLMDYAMEIGLDGYIHQGMDVYVDRSKYVA